MSVGTIGVILRANEFVRRRRRGFVIRGPSTSALSALELCGMSLSLGRGPEPATTDSANSAQALGSWVQVPVTDGVPRGDEAADPKPSIVELVSSTASGLGEGRQACGPQ